MDSSKSLKVKHSDANKTDEIFAGIFRSMFEYSSTKLTFLFFVLFSFIYFFSLPIDLVTLYKFIIFLLRNRFLSNFSLTFLIKEGRTMYLKNLMVKPFQKEKKNDVDAKME
jgi:hypothetical protein